MTSARLHQLYLIGIALLLVAGGFLWWRHDIQQKAILDFKLHAQDSTSAVRKHEADSIATVALGAASDAQAQKVKALAQVAAGVTLQHRTDSLARQASNERDAATRLLADSLASIDQLRLELGSLVGRTRADSAASAQQHTADIGSIHALLATIAADETALTASQKEVAALKALNASTAQELKLVRQSQPSTFGNVVRLAGYVAGGFAVGHFVK